MVASFLSLFYSASAQPVTGSSEKPTGITVSPAFQLVKIKASERQHPLQFKITNNRSTAQTIRLSTADFNTLGESGGLVFVGTNPTELQKKYGLAEWLSLPQKTITVKPKQTVTVRASVSNESSLAPGGHYGAVMFSLDTGDSTGQNKIALQPIASSLLFATKLGGDIHKLELASVDVQHSIFQLPDVVNLRFQNTGNTHVIPRGTVTIKNGDKIIKNGVINENSNIILPEAHRLYSVPLKEVASANIPGTYKLTVDFRFDGYDQFRSYQTSLFLLTPAALVTLLVALTLIIATVYFLLRNQRTRKHFAKIKRKIKKQSS